ncbi:MAG: protease complex subunit PrcB family protein [Deltaproteobacteria bacterium]|nr:protease complex subunit PrcB family protein [Deltaproteobacteria bacterium]
MRRLVLLLCMTVACATDLDDDDFVSTDVPEEADTGPKADQPEVPFTIVEGLTLKASIGKTEEGRVIRSTAAFKTAFGAGVAAPVDFDTEWLAVYSAGVRPTGGYEVAIDRIALSDTGKSVKVQSRLVKPGTDCAVTQALTKPVVIVKFAAQPGATTSRFAKTTEVRACGGPTCGQDLTDLLGETTLDLLFLSETDAPLTPISFGMQGPATVSLLRSLVNPPAGTIIEQRSFDAFFDHQTTVFDPDEPEAVESAARFQTLRETMEAHLTNRTVIRVGRISIDVYILGTSACGELIGLKTLAVET